MLLITYRLTFLCASADRYGFFVAIRKLIIFIFLYFIIIVVVGGGGDGGDDAVSVCLLLNVFELIVRLFGCFIHYYMLQYILIYLFNLTSIVLHAMTPSAYDVYIFVWPYVQIC